jgi:hypothetical protein
MFVARDGSSNNLDKVRTTECRTPKYKSEVLFDRPANHSHGNKCTNALGLMSWHSGHSLGTYLGEGGGGTPFESWTS